MAKKPRENRVPIMMSADELTQIDDWRFANRVATRSDAVRRLVQIGLSTKGGLSAYVKRSEHALKALMLTYEKMSKADRDKLPKGIRWGLAVAMEEQLAAYTSALTMKIEASVFSTRGDYEIGDLRQRAETMVATLRGQEPQS